MHANKHTRRHTNRHAHRNKLPPPGGGGGVICNVRLLVEGEFSTERLVFLGFEVRVDKFLGADELQLNLLLIVVVGRCLTVVAVRVIRLRYVHICSHYIRTTRRGTSYTVNG